MLIYYSYISFHFSISIIIINIYLIEMRDKNVPFQIPASEKFFSRYINLSLLEVFLKLFIKVGVTIYSKEEKKEKQKTNRRVSFFLSFESL